MEMIVKRQFISRVLIKNHMFDLINVNFYSLESQAADDWIFWQLSSVVAQPLSILHYDSIPDHELRKMDVAKYKNRKNISRRKWSKKSEQKTRVLVTNKISIQCSVTLLWFRSQVYVTYGLKKNWAQL